MQRQVCFVIIVPILLRGVPEKPTSWRLKDDEGMLVWHGGSFEAAREQSQNVPAGHDAQPGRANRRM